MIATSDGYHAIADYGLIGNTHTAALVARDGSIDWCCMPHFDSPAVFLRLLDARQGGYFQICPHEAFESQRAYVGESAILATTFSTARGRVRVVDFMHAQDVGTSRIGIDLAHCHRILRLVEGIEGDVPLVVRFRPTLDYARGPTELDVRPAQVVVRGGLHGLVLDHPADVVLTRAADEGLVGGVTIRAGERRWFVVSYVGASGAAHGRVDAEELLDDTQRNWQRWSSQCKYDGPYHSLVRVSARVLKLLTFGPTGALVAAPTTSLPEEIGGVRNWDYRYAWLRDSALILRALVALGYHQSALDFFQWLERVARSEERALQIMYGIGGEPELPESSLIHLEGYRGSRPVRIGNGAAMQVQLDVFGYVVDAAWVCHRDMGAVRPALWRVLRRFADAAAERWREPDHGIWEVRGGPRHFVSSKLMCWVALDRALQLASATGSTLDGDVDLWRTEREAIRRAILDHGYNALVGAFTQTLDGAALDASVLMIPLVGFLPANDPRMRSTIDAVAGRLSRDGLVYRYVEDDGLPGGEATFALCTFWLVENLALLGDVDRARALFERVTSFANDLGLMSEEIAADGALLGNFPQGFTHLGLIHAALRIAESARQTSNAVSRAFARRPRSP